MSRFFNGREIELLAPAGTFEDFNSIVNSSADAIYLGGKDFNMRMHRRDYNFSNEEIQRAVKVGHGYNKKIYITFNNMMNDVEIERSREFLLFLNNVKPDALIIQDMGALSLIKELQIDIPIHSSVMMNVHNMEMIRELYALGITRVVTSREMSLETIGSLSLDTEMEFEYFIHGDMCIAHGSQCLYSGLLFGKSSNRGLCMKPCRWPFKAAERDEKLYSLAVKDMSMFRHIPELINSGVTSFKIEGRMRDSKYLTSLIDMYGRAIDRYIEDPSGYYVSEDFMEIESSRVRNLSTAYAFKIPGKGNMDVEGKREPRVFSRATGELDINEKRISEIKNNIDIKNNGSKPLLTVRVNNLEGLKSCVDNGADAIYLPGDVFREDKPLSKKQIKEAVLYAGNRPIYISLPRMMHKREFAELLVNLEFYRSAGIKGFITTNLGAISVLRGRGFELIGDYSLNCYNSRAANFYGRMGVSRMAVSIEAPARELESILTKSEIDMEVIVQGAPVIMYLEHCIYAADRNITSRDWCLEYCKNNRKDLIDENGTVHPVYADQYCRNNIITSKDICYLPILKEIMGPRTKSLRIEGQHYSSEVIGKVTGIYRGAIDGHKSSHEDIKRITSRGQGFGALNYNG